MLRNQVRLAPPVAGQNTSPAFKHQPAWLKILAPVELSHSGG
jgi:hypothetical protein